MIKTDLRPRGQGCRPGGLKQERREDRWRGPGTQLQQTLGVSKLGPGEMKGGSTHTPSPVSAPGLTTNSLHFWLCTLSSEAVPSASRHRLQQPRGRKADSSAGPPKVLSHRTCEHLATAGVGLVAAVAGWVRGTRWLPSGVSEACTTSANEGEKYCNQEGPVNFTLMQRWMIYLHLFWDQDSVGGNIKNPCLMFFLKNSMERLGLHLHFETWSMWDPGRRDSLWGWLPSQLT